MYPLVDSSTIARHGIEERRAARAARLAHEVHGHQSARFRNHRVRRAFGTSLVRAGLKLMA